MNYRRIIPNSILSGIAISIGGAAFTAVGGITGAVLFTFGLITTVHFKWELYTGVAGFVNKASDLWNMLVVIIFNAVGCWLAGVAVGFGRPELIEQAQTLLDVRLGHTWWECFVLAIGCGFIVTVAVLFARRGKWLPLIFGVPAFIICGFLHSIADAFYIALAGDYSCEMLARWVAVIIGNFVGCNLVRIVSLSRENLPAESTAQP